MLVILDDLPFQGEVGAVYIYSRELSMESLRQKLACFKYIIITIGKSILIISLENYVPLGSMTSIVKYHLATDNNIIITIIAIIPQRFICKL